MRKGLALLIALLLLVTALPALATEAAAPVVVTIFHTNDVHGRYNNTTGMGYAFVSTLVNQARAAKENVLVLDAGDTFHGTIFALANKGESVAEILNTIGYDAMTPGNHDFNYGLERQDELAALLNFPMLSANLKNADGTDRFAASTVVEVGGKKIGIVGASNPELKSSIHPNITDGLDFQGIEPVNQAVQALRKEGVDAVIVLAHWGSTAAYEPNAQQALASIEGVSLVIDGHSHTVLYDIVENAEGPLVVQTGEYLNNLGKVTLTFTEDALHVEATLIAKPKLFEDKAVLALVSAEEAKQGPELDVVIGSTTVDLVGERAIVRTSESNWGNLATEAFFAATGADVAIMNGGNIRATTPAGDIRVRDVNTVFPFGNLVVTQKVTGQDIIDVLEVGLSGYPDAIGGFPQVGGIRFTFDPAKDKGSRIVEITIGGVALDPAATYTLVTNDYLAAGGDNYAALAAHPVELYVGTMDEVIINYLKEHSPVAPEVDGRITAL